MEQYFETRTLVYFYTVAKNGSYREAAAELGVSISTLSRPIQQLERDLGVLLLVRGGRHQTILTEAGAYFFHRTTDALRMLSEIPRRT